MKLSIIIPAYNEEKYIGRCLDSVHRALAVISRPDLQTEIIVADNNSTDATAELARAASARVVFEPIQQISRARNAGGRVATGDWFLFIDADSMLDPRSLEDMLGHVETNSFVGGGSVVGLDVAPVSARLATKVWNAVGLYFKLAAGSFVFCRADAFRDVGGFSEEHFAAEEVVFSQALKRWGRARGLRFVILRRHYHVSSGRKFYLYTKREIFALLFRILWRPCRTLRDRKHLDLFYDGRR